MTLLLKDQLLGVLRGSEQEKFTQKLKDKKFPLDIHKPRDYQDHLAKLL
ncbi:MAG: hypothetical protein H6765_02570 [Candidatus Peribacteria bacterium]|nr:MAG: hypothetical protein H6765_02570 [Candidatus Peribacteria bacterium]